MRPSWPSWVRLTASRAHTPVPWKDVVRSALTVPVVLLLAFATVGASGALFASLAALLVVLSERSGTTGQRLLRTCAGLGAGLLAMIFGPLTGGTGVVPLLVVLCFGLLSGVLSGITSGLSWAGMQLLVQMSIAGGLAIDISPLERVASYAAGGAVALAVMVTQSALERTSRLYWDAAITADLAVREWARLPKSQSAAMDADARLDEARNLLVWARPLTTRRRLGVIRARLVLGRALVSALAISEGGTGATPDRVLGSRHPWDHFKVSLTDRRTWMFVGRLELCLLVGELARQVVPLGHGYWILLTIALTLKPDFAPVFARTVQRGVGTVAGLLLGCLVLLIPSRLVTLPVLTVLGATVPYTVRRNYGWFSVIITPQVFVLLDLGQQVVVRTLVERGANTLLGCVIVLVLGNALWPGTWARALERELRELQSDVEAFLRGPIAVGSIAAAERRLDLSRAASTLRDRLTQQAATSIRPTRYLRMADQAERARRSLTVISRVGALQD
jgi:hypothetical protein